MSIFAYETGQMMNAKETIIVINCNILKHRFCICRHIGKVKVAYHEGKAKNYRQLYTIVYGSMKTDGLTVI